VLRQSLENTVETVQELELAAEARYWEGLELMALGRRGAGIYLMGYAAEMHLELACFRLMGAAAPDPVTPLRASACRRAKQWGVTCPDEGCHSLMFWFALVERQRADLGKPCLAVDFGRCVERLYRSWWVEMRYRSDVATDADASRVFEDVSWLAHNYADMWSRPMQRGA
jgi:hypothetical protein